MNLIWNRYNRALVIQCMQYLPIHKDRVLCICWEGTQYNCNPRAIVEQMVKDGLLNESNKQFSVVFVLDEAMISKVELPAGVQSVLLGSFEYFKFLATARFIISNVKFGGRPFWSKPKRKGQIYIQTMHGGHGIKRIEHDAILPQSYMKVAVEDVKRTDLMISESSYLTKLYRTAFHYYGEVLEKGLPRNDVFFRPDEQKAEDKRYLIYTPTFRNNGRRDVYGFNFDLVISALERRFGGEWYIRISSHPNMKKYYHKVYNFSHPRLIDVGGQDLQTLLKTSDVLITDYSSAAMDFSLTRRPIFQLCPDRNDYDRGFYIQPEDLPFPFAETDDQLAQNILQFDNQEYQKKLDKFNNEIIGLKETGHAAESVVQWMLDHK